MPPPKIEKGASYHTDAPDSHPFKAPVSPKVYRCDAKDASHGPLRLIHDDGIGEKLIQYACNDVRAEPSRLPLWAYRLYSHQRLGRLGYQQVWDALYEAGREVGSDKWVRGCLLHSIAQANESNVAPPSMTTLLRGLV